MGKQTRDQQVKVVVEGLALGTLALGVRAVTASKLDLEFALGHAMRSWSYADDFPGVRGFSGLNYLWIGMRKSERRQTVLAAWSDGQWLTPYVLMEGWTVEDCTDVLGRHGTVPHDGWVELATLFVQHLGEGKVQH